MADRLATEIPLPPCMRSHSPVFHRQEDGEWINGQFLGGREPDLHGQTGAPLLTLQKIAMPDKASAAARITENRAYVVVFEKLHGQGMLANLDAAHEALHQSTAVFELTTDATSICCRRNGPQGNPCSGSACALIHLHERDGLMHAYAMGPT